MNLRRYDLDWLRVLVFLLLIFHHAAMLFAPYAFYIKNDSVSDGFIIPMFFIKQWRLPILFVISGMGTYFALSKRNWKEFLTERISRLFIPLIIGVLIIVPPQVYFERLDKGQFTGSFFNFLTSVAYSGFYPEGNISWHHLWFLPYLLIYTLLLLPFFLYLRKHKNAWFMLKIMRLAKSPIWIFTFILPLFIWEYTLQPLFPSTRNLFNDWHNFMMYLTLFLFGFLLISTSDIFWNTVLKYRRNFLYCGIVGFTVVSGILKVFGNDGIFHLILSFFIVFNLWSWILALFGYASKYLNKPGPVLSYTNQAVYPFYILHQTVTITIGYYLLHIEMGISIKFIIVLAGTFFISWLIYEFGIRRIRWIRPLFGLKHRI